MQRSAVEFSCFRNAFLSTPLCIYQEPWSCIPPPNRERMVDEVLNGGVAVIVYAGLNNRQRGTVLEINRGSSAQGFPPQRI